MIERGYRIVGWILVVLGASVPFASFGSHYRGEPIPWWEPLVLIVTGASTMLVGLAFALPNPGPGYKVVALSIWGAFLTACGVVALLLPAEVLVSRGRGPRTIVMAQLRGGLMLGTGGALIWWAVVLAVRRRQPRSVTDDRTSR